MSTNELTHGASNVRNIGRERSYQYGPAGSGITITADDRHPEYGPSHSFLISYGGPDAPVGSYASLSFQKGPTKEAGPNGVTAEAVLTVVVDYLEGLQTTKFACRENALALTNIEQALFWLRERMEKRIEANTAGTSKV